MHSAKGPIRALITKAKGAAAKVESIDRGQLPCDSTVKASPGLCHLRVAVEYSTLNYKDALVVTGSYPGLKAPMIGGIDLVGTVIDSKSDAFRVGDAVLVNGFGIGTDHFGGFCEEASVRSEWAMALSDASKGLTTLDAARIGTAGYTAMLCVNAIQNSGVKKEDGPILVTGATGGVGSVAVALLSELGYSVTALTGKSTSEAWLKRLGASNILLRSEFDSADPKPLAKETWSGCVDTAGGRILTHALTTAKYGAPVTACGLVAGMSLASATVAPFILRGVKLVGIDSVFLPLAERKAAYARYTQRLLDSKKLDLVCDVETQSLGLEQVPDVAAKMLKGDVQGRFIVRPGKSN